MQRLPPLFHIATARQPEAVALPLLGVVLAIACVTAPGAAQAQDYVRAQVDDDGPYLFWRERFIAFNLDSEGCPDMALGHTRSAVVRSFNTWESQPCTDIFFDFDGMVAGAEPNHFSRESDGYNLIIWLRQWPEEWAGQLGVTSYVWNERTGELLDVDICLNAQDFYWTASDITVTDVENVLTHEIGHFLGFGHIDDPDATMYEGYSDGETIKRDLSAADIRGLCEVYPAGHLTPDMPDLGMDDHELGNAGCQCTTSGKSGAAGGAIWLLLLVVGLIRSSRRSLGGSGQTKTR